MRRMSCRLPPRPWKSTIAGPAGRRRRAVGLVERRRELDAVVHAQRQLLRAGGRAAGRAERAATATRSEDAPRSVPQTARQRSPAFYNRRVDPRPVGVFDSGMGGLTVLHECLVTMPHEDFVYLGDGARLPYGPRPLAGDPRASRTRSAAYLEEQGVKLILVACNSATSAALPELQEALAVPVVGVITPEAHAAVQATRNRRIGLLATQATVDAGPLRGARAHARRRRAADAGRVPAARAADRERRPVRRRRRSTRCASTRSR